MLGQTLAMRPLQLRPRVASTAAAAPARPRSLPGRLALACRSSKSGRGKALVAVAATPTARGGEGNTTTVAAAAAAATTAADVVREFYDGVNRRDLAAVGPLIAEGCVYEDLVFPRPFVGRDQIIGFFGEFMGTISPDLQFVIDDISADDSAAVGVTWHLEWRGRPFPFSRGCSFYRLVVSEQGKPQIV
nr:unnamed protein product [Digitaria exilis]